MKAELANQDRALKPTRTPCCTTPMLSWMPCSNPASTDESFGNLQDIFRGGDVLGYSGNMSISNLSASTQDYLKAVWVLGEWSDEPVTQKRIADKLDRKSTRLNSSHV